MARTKIECADAVWNPVTGCTPVSEGCENCYARRMANRLRGRSGYPKDDPFKVTLHPERLNDPLHWKKPRRVFVCSMADICHPKVPDKFIYAVFISMLQSPQHTFLLLTKRPERLLKMQKPWKEWPKHIWVGVTAENQVRADERIPILPQIQAAVRFVSCEPLLGPVDLRKWLECPTCCGTGEIYNPIEDDFEDCPAHYPPLHWIIVGGETGPNARPMHPEWVRSLRDQCQEAGVPFFFKQWGEWFPRDQWEYNPDLILPDDYAAYINGPNTHVFEDDLGLYYPVHRVGRKKAGRILDGEIWDEVPI